MQDSDAEIIMAMLRVAPGAARNPPLLFLAAARALGYETAAAQNRWAGLPARARIAAQATFDQWRAPPESGFSYEDAVARRTREECEAEARSQARAHKLGDPSDAEVAARVMACGGEQAKAEFLQRLAEHRLTLAEVAVRRAPRGATREAALREAEGSGMKPTRLPERCSAGPASKHSKLTRTMRFG